MFSVVIPTYNSAAYIETCVSSVLNQGYGAFELIVVDNSSEDDTVARIGSYRDERVRVVSIRNEGVIAKSRNLGVKLSTYDWICFLDSDDYWDSNKLDSVHTKLVEQPELDLIFHNEISVDEEGRRIEGSRFLVDEKISLLQNFLRYGYSISTSTVAIRKKLIEGMGGFPIDRSYVSAEDYYLWLLVARSSLSFKYLSETYNYNRIRPGSESRGRNHLEAMLSVITDLAKDAEPKSAHKQLCRQRLQLIGYFILRHRWIPSDVFRSNGGFLGLDLRAAVGFLRAVAEYLLLKIRRALHPKT